MKCYRVKDWDKHFENSRTRQLDSLNWVPVPNKHDGESYRAIMSSHNGIVIYGCWHLILQVASRCSPRGTLARDDKTPLTSRSIALKTGASEKDIERALEFLASSEVAWLECFEVEVTPECHSGDTRKQKKASEWNGMEGNGMEVPPLPPKGAHTCGNEDLTFPENLMDVGFHSLFGKWIEARLRMKKPKDPIGMFQAQLNALAGLTLDQAIACINASLMNGWQGIFPDKFSGHAGAQRQKPNSYPTDADHAQGF